MSEVNYTEEEQNFIKGLNEEEYNAFLISEKALGDKCYSLSGARTKTTLIQHTLAIAMKTETHEEKVTALLYDAVGQNFVRMPYLKKKFPDPEIISALKLLSHDAGLGDVNGIKRIYRNETARNVKYIDTEYIADHHTGLYFTEFMTYYAPLVSWRLNYLRVGPRSLYRAMWTGSYKDDMNRLYDKKRYRTWMLENFSRISGIGRGFREKKYSVLDFRQAEEMLADYNFSRKFRRLTRALLNADTERIGTFFNKKDAERVRDSMTLFHYASGKKESVFREVIDKYFGGQFDEKTLTIIMKK